MNMEIVEIYNYYNNCKRVADSVYAALRHMIIKGELPLNSKLDIEYISSKLDISSTSVTEAVKILEYEGYVFFAQGLGYCVGNIDLDDMLSLNNMLAVLTKGAIENINIYDRHSLIMIDESLKQLSEKTNFEMDKKFHITLALVTGNDELIRAMKDVYNRIEWCMNVLNLPDMPSQLIDEHKIMAYYLTKHEDKYRSNMPQIIERHRVSHSKYILGKN